MLFTVFTPTYNRAYILPQLYNSLLNQTNQNFKWLIIDDGSTDNTEELVYSYIEEKKISITYFKQENQGKHIAINNSYEFIETEFIITVDSDDYLLNNAIEICYKLTMYCNLTNVAGFTFFNSSEDISTNKNRAFQKTFIQNELKIKVKGEKSFVLKSEVVKKYIFPNFKDEKFCPESFILTQIMDDYQILFTDYILAKCEYLEDGLSQNIYKRMMMNPNYSLATLKIKYKSNLFNKSEKNHFALNYWDIAIKSKKTNALIQLFKFPLRGTLYYFRTKLFK